MEAILSARHESGYLLNRSSGTAFATLQGIEWRHDPLETVAGWLRQVEDPIFLTGVNADQVVQRLREEVAVEQALRLLLIFSDTDLCEETRELAALDLEELLVEYPTLDEQLATTFYAKPMPASTDLSVWIERAHRAEAVLFVSFLQGLHDNQPHIRRVSEAWDAIPDTHFTDALTRDESRDILCRASVARDLVFTCVSGESVDSFLLRHLEGPERNYVRNFRAIIQAWAGPFRSRVLRRQVEFLLSDLPLHGEEREVSRLAQRRIRPIPLGVAEEKIAQLKAMIRADVASGRFTEVVKHTDWLIEFQLDHGDPRYAGMSLCDLASEAKKDARSDYQVYFAERAVDVSPGDVQCWCIWGDALLKVQRLDDALAAYEQAIRDHPDNVVSKGGRAEVLRFLNRFDDALAAYEQAMRDHPDEVVLKSGRAEVLRDLNRLEDALAAYEQAIHEHPEDVVPKSGRAEVLRDLNRLEDALAAYERAIREHPEDVVAKSGRAEVLRDLNRLEDALAAYEQAIHEHPEDVVAKCGRAEVLRDLNRLDDALTAYEQAIRDHPGSAVSKNGRAEVLRDLNRLDDALAGYEQAIRDHPGNVVSKNGRAEVLRDLNRLDDALAAYRDTMATFPQNRVSRNGYASILGVLGRWEEALNLIPPIHPTSRQDWIDQHLRGMLFLRSGDRRSARKLFAIGMATLIPASIRGYYQTALAVCDLRDRRPQRALELLQTVPGAELRKAVTAIRAHAFGASNMRGACKSALEVLTPVQRRSVRELATEIDARYLHGKPHHDEGWLFDREERLLLSLV